MVADNVRVTAYIEAMRRAIKPGASVLDLGAGPGFFSVIACRLGAQTVYAVDINESVFLAKEVAGENGIRDRLTVFRRNSADLTLPAPVDVLVSDLRGVLPLHGPHLHTIRDARRRHLADGGRQIPESDLLFLTGIEDSEIYSRATRAADTIKGVSLAPLLSYLQNQPLSLRSVEILSEKTLLTSDSCWAEIDYTSNASDDVAGKAVLSARRSGTLHGYIIWFRTRLVEDVGFDTRPGRGEQVYGHVFFPLSRPIEMALDDSIEVEVGANWLGDRYIWRWRTKYHDQARGEDTSYVQSTFHGSPVVQEIMLARQRKGAVSLSEEGLAARRCLTLMAEAMPTEEIVTLVREEFPTKFPNELQALTFVSNLTSRFGS